jgi:Flp pilus assembly protein TadD
VTTDPEHCIALGRQAFSQGNYPAAEAHFRAAHAAGGQGFEVLSYLGYLARTRGDHEAAGAHYADALEVSPTDAPTHSNLAEIRRAQGRIAEAIALLRRAAALAPEGAEIQSNLGTMLLAARRPEAAIAPLTRAVTLDPLLTVARSDLAIALCALNRYPEAVAQYRAAYRVEPANNNARYLEALALLAMGDFANGWRKHECRWYAELGRAQRMSLPGPSWLGEPDIAGRVILLHAEQGLGDTIQFVRYAPMVAALGARVLLLVPAAIAAIVAGMPGITRVLTPGEALPPFDTHCSLMSLPRAFRTTIDTIPAPVPYVHLPPDRMAAWAGRVGARDGRRRIALAWSGSTALWNRSMPLSTLAPLLDRTDCAFHVAQTEIADSDRVFLRDRPDLIDHSGALRDFADTAALLSQMDLVISVDTALVHLAGAMAHPVWTLLPFGADYRWMRDGGESPWYPTMRLFRQPGFDDWPAVLAAVGRALDRTPS